MTRTERWKAKREAAKKEMFDFDAYIERLEDENDRLHRRLTEALIRVKDLECDNGILQIENKFLKDAKN